MCQARQISAVAELLLFTLLCTQMAAADFLPFAVGSETSLI